MIYQPHSIKDVVVLVPNVFEDERGFFLETFRQSEFEKYCGNYQFVQDNHSKSKQGVLRGLHYQYKKPQGKLVRVSQGEVFDVVVDMRKGSSTFGQWVGTFLSAENKQLLWIPPGFAHGFYVISNTAEFQYKCTDYYNSKDEYCLAWDDPTININWPLLKQISLQLSSKDQAGLAFADCPKF